MKHQVYIWYGYPVRLDKHIGRIVNHDYWLVTPLYGNRREQMMIVKK